MSREYAERVAKKNREPDALYRLRINLGESSRARYASRDDSEIHYYSN